jgi:hypothetical protein
MIVVTHSLSFVSEGHIPPVSLFIALEGFRMRVWPGGHDVLRRDHFKERQVESLPLKDVEISVPAGHCVVIRFDLPHAGGTITNVRLCTVIGNSLFDRPLLDDGSAYVDNVNFKAVQRRKDLFRNPTCRRTGHGTPWLAPGQLPSDEPFRLAPCSVPPAAAAAAPTPSPCRFIDLTSEPEEADEAHHEGSA